MAQFIVRLSIYLSYAISLWRHFLDCWLWSELFVDFLEWVPAADLLDQDPTSQQNLLIGSCAFHLLHFWSSTTPTKPTLSECTCKVNFVFNGQFQLFFWTVCVEGRAVTHLSVQEDLRGKGRKSLGGWKLGKCEVWNVSRVGFLVELWFSCILTIFTWSCFSVCIRFWCMSES